MKKIFLILLSVCLLGTTETMAQSMTGRDVMLRVKNRPDGETRQSEMELTLVKKNGTKRVRKLTSWAMDEGPDCKKVMFFTYPGDVKGTGFLTWDYDDMKRDDDKWLYLPAMKKTRRISGASSKTDYFMGTDFTYGDMGGRNVDEDRHELLREEERDGHRCWVVKSVPVDKHEVYSYKVTWIRQDCDVVVYAEYYDKNNTLHRVFKASNICQVQGFWTTLTLEMTNVQTGHSTLMTMQNPRYDMSIDKSLFTVAKLEQGL